MTAEPEGGRLLGVGLPLAVGLGVVVARGIVRSPNRAREVCDGLCRGRPHPACQ